MAARALAGLAAGAIMPMSLAYISETVAYEERQSTLARFMTGAILGSIGGFTLSGAFSTLIDWRYVFVALSLGLAGVSICLWMAMRRMVPVVGSSVSQNPVRQYVRILCRGWPQTLLALVALEGFFVLGALPIIAVALESTFELSDLVIGLVLGCLGIGGLVYVAVSKSVIRRLGEIGCAIAGGGLIMAGYVLVAIAFNLGTVALGTFCAGFGYVMLQNTLQTNATQMDEDRSGAVTLFSFNLYVGQAVGVATLALLCPLFGLRILILVCAVAAGLLGTAFVLARTSRDRLSV